ncbi:hypothetical protein BDN70DRAFT_939640 [Pholiota conissans]|uniref:Uncharacterized protein n=1 Tax=Pholiota conissans TaxID=109636 RepID=A0A9P5YMG9_9AGAR|nr:hypothetical protein BDN70DRAFT_939640 [Pholiota conissans]
MHGSASSISGQKVSSNLTNLWMKMLNIDQSSLHYNRKRAGQFDIKQAFEIHEKARQALDDMEAIPKTIKNTWVHPETGDEIPAPGRNAVINLFISTSSFNDDWKCFREITDPEMKRWLRDDPNALRNEDVWGINQIRYGLQDLRNFNDHGKFKRKKKATQRESLQKREPSRHEEQTYGEPSRRRESSRHEEPSRNKSKGKQREM